MESRLTDDEFYVLDCAVEYDGPLVLLAWLGTDEHQSDRAAEIVRNFLAAGLVQIAASSDESPRQGDLSTEEALRALADPRKWRDWRVEPFTRSETYYMVVATPAGQSVWEQEVTRRLPREPASD